MSIGLCAPSVTLNPAILSLPLACPGVNTASINVHLPYEPLGVRPLLGETPNPNLSSAQQQVTRTEPGSHGDEKSK